MLDWYGYNTIEEYLSWNYFPSTKKDITNKDITDEDCIHESNYAMSKGKYVPVSHKHNLKVKSHVPVTGCVLGLANVTTWDEIVNKIGVRKSEICADKAKGKKRCHMEADHVLVKDQICDVLGVLHLQFVMFLVCLVCVIIAIGASNCSLHLRVANACLHLHHAFACCICSLHLQVSIRKQAFAACICKQAFTSKHLQVTLVALATCICILHLKVAYPATSTCSIQTYPFACNCNNQCIVNLVAFTASICILHLKQAFAFAFALLCNKHLQQAFATSICFAGSYCNKNLQQAFATSVCFAASYCNKHLHLAFALQLTFSASI
ncbi:hypothetical protein Tco_0883887 [Tanacetum coccineum]